MIERLYEQTPMADTNVNAVIQSLVNDDFSDELLPLFERTMVQYGQLDRLTLEQARELYDGLRDRLAARIASANTAMDRAIDSKKACRRLLARALCGVVYMTGTEEQGWSNDHACISAQSNAYSRFRYLRGNCWKALDVIKKRREE